MKDKVTIIFNLFLLLHIVGGSLGLLAGLLNIVRKKGDKIHKLIGKVFYLAMLTAGFSSLILSCLHPNYFLFMVGIFTLYMVASGQHYLKLNQQGKPDSNLIGWGITFLMLLSGFLFVGIGILTLIKSNFFGLVFLTFGSIGLLFVLQDFKNFRNKSAVKNFWLLGHFQRMTGGFIAALTAFLVVNSQYFPDQIPSFLNWLIPTVIFTPLIIKWSKHYEIKMK